MPYKDEKGHFTNKENAGGPCHHEDGGSTSENKQKYTPQSKTEIAVEEYMNKHWDTMDKNKSVGELAYKISAMVGKPYPQVLDAVTKSIAARQDNPGFDDDYEEEFGEYTGREPGGIKGDLERAGFDDVEVVDDKTLKFTGPNAQAGWTIKENENAGFDVYDETGKKVINDFNATRGNLATAMLQREQNPMKDFDEIGKSSERENLRKEVENKLKKEGNTSDVRLMAERRGFKIENGKVVEDLKSQAMADRATGGSGEDFDEGDYEPAEDNSSYESYKNHMSDYRELSPSLAADFEEDISSDRDLSDKQKEELLNQLHQIPTKPDGESIRRKEENKEPYKSKYEPEDFEDARFYPTKSNMDGNRWVGRYRGIGEALGLKDWNDERVKYVGDHNGTSIVQLPDGYYSINPNITSMSFKTKEALEDYLDRKNPEEHKYGVYWDGDIQRTYRGKDDNGKEYDMEGPDAYKAARKSQQSKQEEEKLSKELMTSLKMPGDEVERFLKDLPEDKKKILINWLLNTKRM